MDSRWKFSHDVRGWLSEEEGRFLAELATGRTVLEIGSFCGRSTICMAQTARIVYALDWHRGDRYAGHERTLVEFWENIERYGLTHRVVPLVGRVEQISGVLAKAWADVILIDGAHDQKSAEGDVELARRCLKDAGILAFHDFCADCQPVKHLVKVLVESGWWSPQGRAGTMIALREGKYTA